MNLISIRDYAKSQNVSYEAVRQQVVLYAKELEQHIIKQNRTRFLDEYAVEFLTARRREHPIILMNQTKDEELEEMKAEIDRLREQLVSAQNQLLTKQEQIVTIQEKYIALQEERQEAIQAKAQYEGLLTMHETTKKELSEAKDQLAAAQNEISRAEAERDAEREHTRQKDAELQTVTQERETIKRELAETQRERDEAKEEAQRFKPSFFGFYRKV